MDIHIKVKEFSSFIANTDTFNAICMEIEGNLGSAIPQPVLIIGEEGSGKTTMLQRIKDKYSSINFAWIDGRFIFSTADIINHITDISHLIIDNFDYYLIRCPYEEQFRLRRFLYNEGAPMLIASISKLVPALTEYKAPFFEGLKKLYINPITKDTLSSLFDSISIGRASEMYEFVNPTIESVEIIFQIIILNNNTGKDIDLLLARYSAQYKLIYKNIPIKSQHILNVLGNSEISMTVPEIRDISGLSSGILTPYLKSLEKKGLIATDKSIKRSTRYYIKSPLFKRWLKNS